MREGGLFEDVGSQQENFPFYHKFPENSMNKDFNEKHKMVTVIYSSYLMVTVIFISINHI